MSACTRELAERAVLSETGSTVEISRAAFGAANPALRRRLIMNIAKKLAASAPRMTLASIESVDALCVDGRAGSRALVSDNVEFLIQYEKIIARKVSADSRRTSKKHVVCVPVPGCVSSEIFGVEVATRVLDRSQSIAELVARCGPDLQLFDADKVHGDLSLRAPQPGDFFCPLGLGGRKKLSDYFTDIKYPRDRRQHALLLLAEEDIMWIVGGAADEQFKLTDATQRVLEVRCARTGQTV